jgi:hypothetical protein
VIAAAGVVVVMSAGLVAAGCGSSAKRAADTTPVPVPSTSEPRPTTTWSRRQAESEVRAAYQNFRVKLRELGRHPSPNSPIIDELYVPGAFMNSVRTSQRRLLARGLVAYPSPKTRWRITSVALSGRRAAVVSDCFIDGEVMKKGSVVVDDAVNTYEGKVSIVHVGGRWLVDRAEVLRARRGVRPCAAR